MFLEYDKVKIKKTGKHGMIVSIDTDGGTKPPIYFVEIDRAEKTEHDEENMFWCEENELEKDCR